MDMKKLVEPYSEDGRTIEGQVKWLANKGVPRNHVDQALLLVYDLMERGKTFANGHDLDHELLRVAKEAHDAEVNDSVKKLEDFFNSFKGKWNQEEFAKRSFWQRVKAVFRP